jgi:hypothetical protein
VNETFLCSAFAILCAVDSHSVEVSKISMEFSFLRYSNYTEGFCCDISVMHIIYSVFISLVAKDVEHLITYLLEFVLLLLKNVQFF